MITDEASEVSALSVINSTLRALQRRLTRLNREIVAETGDYDSHLTRDLTTIARTLKELAAEKRKLEDRDSEVYDSLGIEGRMDLMVDEFFGALPEDFQVLLLSKMRDRYNEQNASLLPLPNLE